MKQWIVTAGGDSVPVEGKLVPFVLGKAPLFCLTEDDKLFVASQYNSGHAEDVEYALLSRILIVGTAVECDMNTALDPMFRRGPPGVGTANRPARVRGWRHVGSPSPPSPLEPGKELKDEDDPTLAIWLTDAGELAVLFHRESYPMWKRLMDWITRAPVETGINPRTVVGLKEWGETQRSWCQDVEGIFKGHQFSKDPKKGARCNRCGRQIGWEELLNTQTCPTCGMALA